MLPLIFFHYDIIKWIRQVEQKCVCTRAVSGLNLIKFDDASIDGKWSWFYSEGKKKGYPRILTNRQKFQQEESSTDSCFVRIRGERCAIHDRHKSCQLKTAAGSHNFGDQTAIYIHTYVCIYVYWPYLYIGQHLYERERERKIDGERTRTDKCLKGTPPWSVDTRIHRSSEWIVRDIHSVWIADKRKTFREKEIGNQ